MLLAPRKPSLPARDLIAWRELIHHRCGLDFDRSRESYLGRCLRHRMRAIDVTSYTDYFGRIALEGGGRAEWSELLELLVNRETSFFRHGPSFNALRDALLPRLLASRSGGARRQIRLWSAACSTGEEAYSVAMCALEACQKGAAPTEIAVVGSDVSRISRSVARAARYPAPIVDSLPARYRRYLKVCEADPALVEIDQQVRRLVRFKRWNAVSPPEGWETRQDLIFCQNLLIHLRPEKRFDVVKGLCRSLVPGGMLFLGPGELLDPRISGMERTYVYGSLAFERVR